MSDSLHHRTISRFSTEYVAALLFEGVAESGLDILDFAIVLVVCAGNIGRLKSNPATRLHEHGAQPPVPAEIMAPTSLRTVIESLKLVEDVAHGRLEDLANRGILIRTEEDGYAMGAPVNASDAAARLADKNAAMTRRFVRRLADAGIAA